MSQKGGQHEQGVRVRELSTFSNPMWSGARGWGGCFCWGYRISGTQAGQGLECQAKVCILAHRQ